ncbi:MAG TPA: peptide chain release factor 1 [Candidatus Humimicrobiaceae bacterium]|nr:peptide chain release factor 1 [Candidatus Humimicrobiaceae bacterium]
MFDITEIKKEYNEVLQQLADPELISDWEKNDNLIKRKNYLERIINKEKEINDLENKIEENKTILKSQEEKELFSLAETEIIQLEEKKKILEEELKKILSEPQEKKDIVKSVIMEIRAGAGGEEASLFVADLSKMYLKYANFQNWKEKLLDSRPSSLNGFKEIVFEISGNEVFLKMKTEAGVHRVQRIPATEKSGRIHTSTVSVAVLPKPQKGKITINPSELKVDTYKSSGPGGQYVNKRMTAIRVTHLPTGLVVTSQTERNLQQNRENALSILEAKLLEKKEMETATKLGQERRLQIGKAQRAEKIRTYNFPQNRVTDHRVKKSFHNIEEIMEGKLEPIIKALSKTTIKE